MNESALVNRQAVLVYLDGARDALRSAQFNLDGGFYGVAVNRAYCAFFYFVAHRETYLTTKGYL
jgi:uncharacterized protein (UPF0332 family)